MLLSHFTSKIEVYCDKLKRTEDYFHRYTDILFPQYIMDCMIKTEGDRSHPQNPYWNAITLQEPQPEQLLSQELRELQEPQLWYNRLQLHCGLKEVYMLQERL